MEGGTKKGSMNPVDRLLQWILLSNYSLAVWMNDWKKDSYSTWTIRLTSTEVFFLLISFFYLIYPGIRTTDDVWFFFTLAFSLFLFCQLFISDILKKKIKDLKISGKYKLYTDPKGWRITGASIFIFTLLTILVLTGFEVYKYYKSVFWWN